MKRNENSPKVGIDIINDLRHGNHGNKAIISHTLPSFQMYKSFYSPFQSELNLSEEEEDLLLILARLI